jgi:hypothetical protein
MYYNLPWKKKHVFLILGKLTEICQKIFVAAHEDEDVEE